VILECVNFAAVYFSIFPVFLFSRPLLGKVNFCGYFVSWFFLLSEFTRIWCRQKICF